MGSDLFVVRSKISLDRAWKGTYSDMLTFKGECPFELDTELVAETVNSCVANLRVRYGVGVRVKVSVLAGFLADAVLTYRPVVFYRMIKNDSERNKANAMLAIRSGMDICAEHHKGGAGKLNRMLLEDYIVNEWFYSSLSLLIHNKYSPESLTAVFEKLCKRVFPDDFARTTVRL